MNKNKVVITIIIVQTIICLTLAVVLFGQQKEQENKGVYIPKAEQVPVKARPLLEEYNRGYRDAMSYSNKNCIEWVASEE